MLVDKIRMDWFLISSFIEGDSFYLIEGWRCNLTMSNGAGCSSKALS
jgi:hypothetical protein